MAAKLRVDEPVGHLGGLRCFLQIWLTVHTTKAIDLRPIAANSFPRDYAENSRPVCRRCMSLEEAAAVVPGPKSSDISIATWFRAFYCCLKRRDIVWFAYEDLSAFEMPSVFCPDKPLVDARSALLFGAFVMPCLLLTRVVGG